MSEPDNRQEKRASSLVAPIKKTDQFSLSGADENSWIEVIHQMDKVYSELIDSQIALEEKNTQLEETQEFITGVMGAMSDLMIVCDKQGNILQVNKALERLTEKPSASFFGKHLTDVLTGKEGETEEKFLDCLRNNQSFSDCEVLVQGVLDEQVPLSVNCSPRHDLRGRIAGLVLIGRPVGELQRANLELDRALKKFEKAQQHLVNSEKMSALGRLVAGVAHELNNPISFVFGNMYALKQYSERITRYLDAMDGPLSNEEIHRLRQELKIDAMSKDILPLVEGTLEGAERISDIVQDLRRFSGNQKEAMEVFQLLPAIQTAVNWVLRGAKYTPEIEIECRPETELLSRAGYVHQILVNLIQNAIDAMADNSPVPRIRISVLIKDKSVNITVEDNGPGIGDEDFMQVFEPFFTTKPIGEGTGLGLYVSYRMAEELGAGLTVANGPGGGAVFTLDIPKTHPGTEV